MDLSEEGTLENKCDLLKRLSVCMGKRNSGLNQFFLFSKIKLSFANGVGITQVKGELFGRGHQGELWGERREVAILWGERAYEVGLWKTMSKE